MRLVLECRRSNILKSIYWGQNPHRISCNFSLKFCMMIFILLCALFAEIIWTIAGFWSSSILLPLLSQMMDFQNVLLLVAIYHIFWNGSRLFYFYKHIHTKIVLLFWIPSILLTIVGAHYSSQIDQQILKFSLGCVLFIFALYSLFRPSWRIQHNDS